ncbi:MAG: hypothetical protein K8H88_33710 [Sandaracinaceae bacterium]|nr:hypothetical protein [Sandaracinaceae bacterium]
MLFGSALWLLGCQAANIIDADAAADATCPSVECTSGTLVACTSACGTEGVGMCTSECRAPDGIPGACRHDCSAQECRAGSEVCNYCDDNGVNGLVDERGLATGRLNVWRTECAEYVPLAGTPCDDATGFVALTSGADQTRGIVVSQSITLGYGEVIVHGTMFVQRGIGCPSSEDGWALVVTDEEGLDALGPSTALGVSSSWRGFAGEWRFGGASCATADEQFDHVFLRPLAGDGIERPAWGGLTGRPALDDGTAAGVWLRQDLRIMIVPDVPGDGTNDMQVTLERRSGGASEVGSCFGSQCLTVLAPGDRIRVGLVAATAASGQLTRGYIGDSGDPWVTVADLCP